MPMMTKPAFGPRAAIAYVTGGALLDVWVAVWYYFFTRHEPDPPRYELFMLTGLFLTGLTFMLIGFYLGRIGRAARKAELPPHEAEREEARIQNTAAATPHPVDTAPPSQPVPLPPPPFSRRGPSTRGRSC